ncbi:probable methyltransferase-like protein 15 [Asterias rubens]|uniref:probable methyltransferase-like protein 15 n=1 Tax=Asterias rubens TaxID=7604 RepID=UPI001455B146|nr:probable methyltransferase-like protein 15 [Asterias rubens]XP_033645883.1 probable methyltransferase-like protein 15 [Asterias rubens]
MGRVFFHRCPTSSLLPSLLTLHGRPLSVSASLFNPRGTRTRISKIQDKQEDEDSELHIPVMREEVIAALSPQHNRIFVDMTFGAGGHTRALLKQGVDTQVYGLDRDPVAFDLAQRMAEKFKGRLHPLLGRFSELETLLQDEGLGPNSVDGILIDAGCSSVQFDTPERGFALSKDGPLDMRMDQDRYPNQPTAADVVNSLDSTTLAKLFKTYGEESHAKRIATAIVEYRQKYRPITTTMELATVISCAFSHTESRIKRDKIGRSAHVATKTFQGLRIFVNNELNELSSGLEMAGKFLRPGGKLAILSFHSLEDRIVKRFFQGREVNEKGRSIHQKRQSSGDILKSSITDNDEEDARLWDPLNRNKVILPSEEEVERNPRSRSAKLRVAVKLGQ